MSDTSPTPQDDADQAAEKPPVQRGQVADDAVRAANRVADGATTAALVAQQAADHARSEMADEAMSTANRASDHKAFKANCAADLAVDVAAKAVESAGGDPGVDDRAT